MRKVGWLLMLALGLTLLGGASAWAFYEGELFGPSRLVGGY